MTIAEQFADSTSPTLELRAPAAVLRYWVGTPGDDPAGVRQAISRVLLEHAGIFAAGSDCFAITPQASDPALFDTAVHWCRLLPTMLQRELDDNAPVPTLRLLISPGEVVLRGSGPELVADSFQGDFNQRPLMLESGAVYLTGWAANQLEQPSALEAAPDYTGPSGRRLPLIRVGAAASSPTPWRNPELLTRRMKRVRRPALGSELRAGLSEPALYVRGPLGCGKTRVVWETLERMRAHRLWLGALPTRRRSSSLAERIARRLITPSPAESDDPLHPRIAATAQREELARSLPASKELRDAAGSERAAGWVVQAFDRLHTTTGQPCVLVCDDLEQIDPDDLALLARLLEVPELGSSFSLLVVGRSGIGPAAPFGRVATVDVPPFDEKTMTAFATQLFAGLSLPTPVQARFLDATHGYPFALEEGMVALIREKSLRRVHGAFFFGGDPTAGYRPSLRLVCHLAAEAHRLNASTPIHLLSLLDMGAPAPDLAAAASILDRSASTKWEGPALAAGLLRRVESPWGPGVAISCPAYRAALAHVVADESGPKARKLLGKILAARSQSGEASWEAYRLLRGEPEAIAPLLKTLKTPYGSQMPREEMLAALNFELERHRERDGDQPAELELLWRLLPLARRQGLLHQHTENLARGVELTVDQPSRLLALAGVKAEMETEAGRYKEAEATIQMALKATKGTDQRRQTLLLIQLGKLFQRQERYGEATELFKSLGRALTQQSSLAMAATCDYYLGNIAFHERRLEEALEYHNTALVKRREQHLFRPTGYSLSALGAVSLAIGNYPQALAQYREAQAILEEHGKEADVSYTLLGVGKALSRLGDYTSASGPMRRALEQRQGKDDVAGEAIARLAVAENYLNLGQPETALQEARQAHFHLSLMSIGGRVADAEQLLGRVRLSQRQYSEAERHLRSALDKHRETGNEGATGIDLAWLLEMASATQDEAAVRRYATELREIAGHRQRPDLGEQIDFHLYRGLRYLTRAGHKVGDPLPYLERAYREVLRKASHIEARARHPFLFQVEGNKAIVETATRVGLSAPGQV